LTVRRKEIAMAALTILLTGNMTNQ